MLQEINANSADLISKYPSGQAVQTLLASRNFGIDKEHIVVCNGASEIINNIINILDIDNIGVIRPTFEEYVNRVKAKGGQIEIYDSSRNNLKYTVDNIIEYFTYKTISSLLLVNPDNPSGNYISKLDIIKLIQWAKECGIKLIIDDSFVDFVNNNENKEEELIEESTLKLYKGLYIIKSLSKSQGIPGLRLGILASSDTDTISKLKKDNTIWNINSYAEFYMQIYKKYEKDHIESLKKTVEDRQKLVEELREIEYITPLDSQTNYICCEVHNIKAIDLAVELLKHNILIQCATSKVNNSREYIRIAVKTQEYNQYLVKNLKEIETSMLHNNKI
jgi:histidinol-phosphate/aromatic aminotransferase/cobyric acid decarboxylase-like protein